MYEWMEFYPLFLNFKCSETNTIFVMVIIYLIVLFFFPKRFRTTVIFRLIVFVSVKWHNFINLMEIQLHLQWYFGFIFIDSICLSVLIAILPQTGKKINLQFFSKLKTLKIDARARPDMSAIFIHWHIGKRAKSDF